MMLKFKKYIYGATTLLWMLNVYGFSAENGTVSGGKSQAIARGIQGILRKKFPKKTSFVGMEAMLTISNIIRKCAHVAAFFLLAVLLVLLIDSIFEKRKIYAPVVFAVLYAAADEFHQSFVPDRTASINDVGIDSCGVILGVIFAFLLLSKLRGEKGEIRLKPRV